MPILFILVAFLFGCSTVSKKDPEPPNRTEELRAKYDALMATAIRDDETGWPSVTDCDALLWASETAAAGFLVNFDFAEHAPGVIHRRPHVPCWNEKEGDVGSKSTISSDHILGYVLGRWLQKDLAALQRLADYGEAHELDILGLKAWVMGKPYPEEAARVVIKPGLVGLVGRMIYVLSEGEDARASRGYPIVFAPGKDYEGHIAALGVYLWGEVEGSIPDTGFVTLDALYRDNPRNYFYGAVSGLYTGAFGPVFDLLLDDSVEVPHYVRGGSEPARAAFARVHRLFAMKIVLDAYAEAEAD